MVGWSVGENHWSNGISPTQVNRERNIESKKIGRGLIRRGDHI